MSERTSADEQTYYICGRCKSKVFHLKSEPQPDECPECYWAGKTVKDTPVPFPVKLDLTRY